ncbi:18373_t:CDS:2, partial [Entrophospora sp. SA101]
MGVLSGTEIKKYLDEKKLKVEPNNDTFIGTASIDLTLGNEFRYFIHSNGPVQINNSARANDYQNFSSP